MLAGRGEALISPEAEWMRGNPDKQVLETVLDLMLLWLRDLLNRMLGRAGREIFAPGRPNESGSPPGGRRPGWFRRWIVSSMRGGS